MKSQEATVTAERIELKIGTLTVNLNSCGYGEVAIDGKAIRCNSLRITVKPSELPVIELSIFAE